MLDGLRCRLTTNPGAYQDPVIPPEVAACQALRIDTQAEEDGSKDRQRPVDSKNLGAAIIVRELSQLLGCHLGRHGGDLRGGRLDRPLRLGASPEYSKIPEPKVEGRNILQAHGSLYLGRCPSRSVQRSKCGDGTDGSQSLNPGDPIRRRRLIRSSSRAAQARPVHCDPSTHGASMCTDITPYSIVGQPQHQHKPEDCSGEIQAHL